MKRITKKALGCFNFTLEDHETVTGEFGTYEAFFDYSMAVKRLGEYEDTGLTPEELTKSTCKWEEDDCGTWGCSKCNAAWEFNEGGPIENSMKYCHECGRKIVEIIPYNNAEE